MPVVEDRLIDKIKKILAKTEEAGCTSEEAETAFTLATRLMAEHNLTMADVATDESNTSVTWVEEQAAFFGRMTAAYHYAYSICAEFCFVIGMVSRTGNKAVMQLFGTKENVELATFMFKEVSNAISESWKRYKRKHGSSQRDARSFMEGMYVGFRRKMVAEREAMASARDASPGHAVGSTALALRNIMEETERRFNEYHGVGPFLGPRFRKTRMSAATHISFDAFTDGVAEGERMNVNRQMGNTESGPKALE